MIYRSMTFAYLHVGSIAESFGEPLFRLAYCLFYRQP